MYHVEFAPNAEADLARLSAPIAQQVLKRLVWLAENFRPGSAWLLGLCTRTWVLPIRRRRNRALYL